MSAGVNFVRLLPRWLCDWFVTRNLPPHLAERAATVLVEVATAEAV